MTAAEEWRPVVGYEGWYEVSNQGRVKRVRRASGTVPGTILKPIFRQGSLSVTLSKEAVEIIYRVHILVMAAFVGPRPQGLVINHIDGNTRNSALENLEYVTQSENCKHAYRTGLVKMVPDNGRCKLLPEQVRAIRKLVGTMTNVAIAKQFNVTGSTIDRIANGEAWKLVE